MMRLATVFITLPIISAYALSSSKAIFSRGDSQDIIDFALSEDAFGSASSPYVRKPDCFRRAAGRIHSRCADIEMDADERVKAAISMTLCELRTAEFHSIPLECEVFLEEGPGASGGRAPHGICVEALSRSTQSWASYSGYLREIPQLCFAYQRSNEKDLALEIYRNATIEKVAYIRRLMQHAKREDEMRTLWQSLLSDLQRSVGDLQTSPSISERIYVDISEKVFGELQQVLRAHQETFDVQLQQSMGHSLALSDVGTCSTCSDPLGPVGIAFANINGLINRV
ncbi:Tht1-like nuclear fusion protein-domain-containing protein [Lactarius hatsudake]|nr:Tht1-like nuclear fusion protein-domain-containing protein [Lactarius hatsudake]